MTPCHNVRGALIQVYLLQKGRTIGRKEIGHIRICPAEKCGKIYGEPVRYAGTGGFSDEEWQKMLKIRSNPPFYFVKTGKGLIPEDAIAADFGRQKELDCNQPISGADLQKFPLTGSEKAAGEALEEPEWMNEN